MALDPNAPPVPAAGAPAGPPDPIFIKAIRDLVTAQNNAQSAKSVISPQDQDAFMREETGGKYGLGDAQKYLSTINSDVGFRNVGRSFTQGVLMNYGDEILGKLPAALGGGAGNEEDMRLRDQLFKQAHPAISATANIAGGVAPFLVPGVGEVEAGAKAAGLGATMARGALTGAVVGGISGSGEGEDAASRLAKGGVGAAGGAILGGTLPALVAGVKSFSPVNRALSRLSDAVAKSGGTAGVQQAAADATAAGRGGQFMLADASDHLRQAADFAANNSDDALVSMAQKIKARQADASDRLLGDVQQGFGGDPNAAEAQDALQTSRKAFANGPNGYGGIREADPPIDISDIQPYLSKPGVRSAWNLAKQAGDIKAGDPLDGLFQRLSASNPGLTRDAVQSAAESGVLGTDAAAAAQAQRPVTFDDLHGFKQILDDKVENAFRQGNGNLGEAYKTVRDGVISALVKSVPDVAGVDAEYARRMSLERALQAGQDAWDQVDTRGLSKQLAAMTPDQVTQFRTGLASQMVTKLRSAATNRNQAQQLIDMSPALEDKVRAAFGDQATFDKFMTNVQQEANLGKLKTVIGGSATARRLQSAGFDPAEIGLTAAMHGPAGMVAAVKAGAAKVMRGAVTRGTASQLSPMLTAQGSAAIDAVLARLQQGGPIVGRFGRAALPAAGGKLASFFDQ